MPCCVECILRSCCQTTKEGGRGEANDPSPLFRISKRPIIIFYHTSLKDITQSLRLLLISIMKVHHSQFAAVFLLLLADSSFGFQSLAQVKTPPRIGVGTTVFKNGLSSVSPKTTLSTQLPMSDTSADAGNKKGFFQKVCSSLVQEQSTPLGWSIHLLFWESPILLRA